MINAPLKRPEYIGTTLHPAWQLLIFGGIFFGALVIGTLIGVGVVAGLFGLKTIDAIGTLDAHAAHILPALWIIQITGTTLPIFTAPVFFAYVVGRDPRDYLKTNFHFHWGLLLIVLFVALLSLPTMEFLSNINEKMKLPAGLKGLEDWMKTSEKEARDITDLMLNVKTVWGLLFDLLLIGLVTAIVEEFMFRGVMQTIFFRWTKSIHLAVWITAILFSAFHMEFYGFLPRLLLGALFGYFVAWSGSIWPAVWAHFLNNGVDVVVTYLSQHKLININPEDEHVFNYWGYAISVIILLLLMLIFRRIGTEQKSIAPV
jgi:membrane protease YdiL (CAAX protease family)